MWEILCSEQGATSRGLLLRRSIIDHACYQRLEPTTHTDNKQTWKSRAGQRQGSTRRSRTSQSDSAGGRPLRDTEYPGFLKGKTPRAPSYALRSHWSKTENHISGAPFVLLGVSGCKVEHTIHTALQQHSILLNREGNAVPKTGGEQRITVALRYIP